jgi:hypothetical protein
MHNYYFGVADRSWVTLKMKAVLGMWVQLFKI